MVNAIQNEKTIVMRTTLKNIVWAIMLIPAIYLLLVWEKLPDVIAMQYDFKGNPTRYGSKNEMIAMVAILTFFNSFYLFARCKHLQDGSQKTCCRQ